MLDSSTSSSAKSWATRSSICLPVVSKSWTNSCGGVRGTFFFRLFFSREKQVTASSSHPHSLRPGVNFSQRQMAGPPGATTPEHTYLLTVLSSQEKQFPAEALQVQPSAPSRTAKEPWPPAGPQTAPQAH